MVYLIWIAYTLHVLAVTLITNGKGLVGIISAVVSIVMILLAASKYENLSERIKDLEIKAMLFERFKNDHIDR